MGLKYTLLLHIGVDVIMPGCSIGIFIMSNVVDLVLLDKGFVNDPGSFGYYFIHPTTMSCSFKSATK